MASTCVVGVCAGWAAAPARAAAAVGPLIATTGLAVSVRDLRERRIPNRLLLVSAAGVVLVGLAVTAVDRRNPFVGIFAGAILGGLPLLVVHLVNPRGMGFGDVRYGFVLGGSLGLIHWSLAAWALLSAASTSLVGMLAVRSWRQSAPFGLFLAGSGLLALLVSRALL